ncbi:hypothetical protein EV193_113140 [Herbihabitans rhizosphaerae]|uniref:Uncharacterized protein n=1 Tax=Herbihabitans rhizosphaerae TaxID=1872711 RepID=A0A4Q7KFI9_9PSEU|nr:hypothetical protein EV193_113140 [Herbihabitans rhizosphaerae]
MSRGADGYDLLSSRRVPPEELRAFLLDCFEISDGELYVGRAHASREELRDLPEGFVFAAFCTHDEVSGHFAMTVDVGIEGRLAERVGRLEFARRFAAHFDAYVLYGHDEPFDLWTVVLPDGTRLLAEMDDDGEEFTLRSVVVEDVLDDRTRAAGGAPVEVQELSWVVVTEHRRDGDQLAP